MSESARFCHFDCRMKRKRVIKGLLDICPNLFGVIAGNDFDLHFKMLHFVKSSDCHLKLVDTSELADYIFDRGRINVHTTDCDHVIASAEQSAIEASEGASASAGGQVWAHQIPGAIADHREPSAAQIRDDQFSDFASRHFLPGLRVEDFGNELAFDQVYSSGLNFALKAVSTDFRSAGMIETLRVPFCFNARFRPRHIGSWFSCVNECLDLDCMHVEVFLAGHFGKTQGIRRSAAHPRGPEVAHHVQALKGIPPAAGNHHRAYFPCPFNRRPKTDKGPERKCQEDAVL